MNDKELSQSESSEPIVKMRKQLDRLTKRELIEVVTVLLEGKAGRAATKKEWKYLKDVYIKYSRDQLYSKILSLTFVPNR